MKVKYPDLSIPIPNTLPIDSAIERIKEIRDEYTILLAEYQQ